MCKISDLMCVCMCVYECVCVCVCVYVNVCECIYMKLIIRCACA